MKRQRVKDYRKTFIWAGQKPVRRGFVRKLNPGLDQPSGDGVATQPGKSRFTGLFRRFLIDGPVSFIRCARGADFIFESCDRERALAVNRHKTHWTSAESRCNRQLGKRFGDDAYTMEELVAELGAPFLCADLDITDAPRADHAQYLANWLSVLKADKKAIFTAAAKASEAAAFLATLQGAGAPSKITLVHTTSSSSQLVV